MSFSGVLKMNKGEDAFSAAKYVHRIGTILGMILFTIRGRPKFRTVKKDNSAKISFVVNCMIILLSMLSSVQRLKIYLTEITSWASVLMMITYYFLLAVSMIFAVIKNEMVIRVFCHFDKIPILNLHYIYIRKCSLFVIIILYTLCFLYTALDSTSRFLDNEFRIEEVFFYTLGGIYPVLLDCQFIIILLLLRITGRELHENIKKFKNLNIVMKIYFDIYDIVKEVDDLLNYLLPRCLATFFGFAYSMYLTALNYYDDVFLSSVHIWNGTNCLSVFIIVYLTEAIKNEVSH